MSCGQSAGPLFHPVTIVSPVALTPLVVHGSGSVTLTSGASVQISAANLARRSLMIVNNSYTTTAWLAFGVAAVAGSVMIELPPKSAFHLCVNDYGEMWLGTVNGIGEGADVDVSYLELDI